MKKSNMHFCWKLSFRLLGILSVFTLCGFSSFAANTSGVRPPWVKGDYPGNNGTYDFMLGEGRGNTLREARFDAEIYLVNSIINSKGVTGSHSEVADALSNNNNGILDEKVKFKSHTVISIDGVRMAFMAVDVYWEYKNSKYECKVLYEVAKNPDHVDFQSVEYTENYGARGLWRSAIVPGWGQMYKGQYAKGAIILGVEAVGVASSLLFENQRSSYCKKAAVSFDAHAIKFYQNKANDAKNVRNLCIIGTSAVYLYNIVDAIVAKGRPRYKKLTAPHLSLVPYFTVDSPMGVSFCYTF